MTPDLVVTDCRAALKPIWPWPEIQGVYFAARGDLIKIGRSNNVRRRLIELQTASAERLELLAVARGGRFEERLFHKTFAADRYHGEWFRFSTGIHTLLVDLHVRRLIAKIRSGPPRLRVLRGCELAEIAMRLSGPCSEEHEALIATARAVALEQARRAS